MQTLMILNGGPAAAAPTLTPEQARDVAALYGIHPADAQALADKLARGEWTPPPAPIRDAADAKHRAALLGEPGQEIADFFAEPDPEAIEEATQEGYNDGYGTGYDIGKNDGVAEAETGIETRLDTAKQDGYEEGHDAGYREGYAAAVREDRDEGPDLSRKAA